jgi:hypothetical protein
MHGRYELKVNKKHPNSSAVLKLISNEEVAFHLYKNRDYITKAPLNVADEE